MGHQKEFGYNLKGKRNLPKDFERSSDIFWITLALPEKGFQWSRRVGLETSSTPSDLYSSHSQAWNDGVSHDGSQAPASWLLQSFLPKSSLVCLASPSIVQQTTPWAQGQSPEASHCHRTTFFCSCLRLLIQGASLSQTMFGGAVTNQGQWVSDTEEASP